jgi:PAS domain S-box-containing protein
MLTIKNQVFPNISSENTKKAKHSLKILVFDQIDYSKAILNELKAIDEINFSIDVISSEEELKNVIKNKKPDLILSELQNNETCGKQFLDYCRMFYPEIPFILFTDKKCNKTALDFLKMGASDYLLKENITALPATIFRAIRQSKEKQEIKAVKQKSWEDSQRFKSLIEYSHDPVITYSDSGIITYASPAIERVLGYTVTEFIGTNVVNHIHPDDLDLREEKFKLLTYSQKNYAIIENERLLHKNGHYIWVKAIVSDARLLPGIEGYMTNFRDITDTVNNKLKLEKTLKSLTEYKVALDESSIVGITDLKGKITYVNNELLTYSKFTKEELINKNFRLFKSDEHPDIFYLKIWNIISSGKIWKGEMKLKAKDKSHFWVTVTVVPFLNENQKPYQYIIVMRDITIRKLRTLELRNTIDLLTSQNKRLLNFSYIVSHNLRSHTSNIQNLIHHIEESDDETEKIEMMQYLKNVAEALNDTLYNLNEVVSVQSNSELKIEAIKLKPFFENTLNVLKSQISESNAIIKSEIPENVEINFSVSYLESILQNLILNSIKYKHPDRNPEIKIDCLYKENYLTLNITDNGIGINLEKYKDKLFGMYKTFHSNVDSKGLGLFMSKNQIEALGGKIEVESKIDKGTTFRLYFK